VGSQSSEYSTGRSNRLIDPLCGLRRNCVAVYVVCCPRALTHEYGERGGGSFGLGGNQNRQHQVGLVYQVSQVIDFTKPGLTCEASCAFAAAFKARNDIQALRLEYTPDGVTHVARTRDGNRIDTLTHDFNR
jgi:hypothetical protein